MNRRASRSLPMAAASIGLLATLVGLAAESLTASRYGRDLVAYAEVERADGTFRRMYVDEAAFLRLERAAPLPEGTTIVMESHRRNGDIGSVFQKTKRDGRWLYGSFPPDRPSPAFSAGPSCRGCHLSAVEDDTFTLPLLTAFAADRVARRVRCERSGRTPCSPDAYAVEQSLEPFNTRRDEVSTDTIHNPERGVIRR